MIGRTRLAEDIHAAGVHQGGVLMVHTRMSALGHVIGGAQTVVETLLDVVGPEGTVMAYTGWEDVPDELDLLPTVQRDLILAEQPAFEPRLARANRSHGRVPEALQTGRSTTRATPAAWPCASDPPRRSSSTPVASCSTPSPGWKRRSALRTSPPGARGRRV